MSTIYAVTWFDNYLGIPLSLHYKGREDTLASAKSIREKGGDKVQDVHAYMLLDGSDSLIDLEELEVQYAEAIHQERTLHP